MPPSSRVTRSAAARQASSGITLPSDTTSAPLDSAAAFENRAVSGPSAPTRNLRKRKAPATSLSADSPPAAVPKKRKSKATQPVQSASESAKGTKRKSKGIGAGGADMSEQGYRASFSALCNAMDVAYMPRTLNESSNSNTKHRSSRSKKGSQGMEARRPELLSISLKRSLDIAASVPTVPARNTKKSSKTAVDADIEMKDADERPSVENHSEEERDAEMPDNNGDDEDDERYREEDYDRDEDDDEDDDDVFEGGYLGGAGGPGGLSSTLRALSGLVSGISSRLRDILESLRQKDDPSTQLIALQELAELLLVSTEDNLSGHFSPDQFIKELVSLMHDQGPFGENPEMMLLACRCIANLMEALPAATANVVYGGAVPVLCAKLMEIQYIDLAEQALSVSPGLSIHGRLLIRSRR